MPANDLYVLPEDVRLIAVKEIAEQSRSKFEYQEDDFIITYTNGRSTSKVIDADSAVLLTEFKKPSSMVEGIFRYAYINKLDPQETLEDSYLFLSRLRSEGFLTLYDSITSKAGKDLLQLGISFRGYEVVEKIQGLTDTEVYKLKQGELFFVLKVLKTQKKVSSLSHQFNNELNILEYLKGSNISPAVVENGEFDDNLYFIMEYFNGTPCDIATEKYRNLSNTENLLQLLTIAINILTAYEALHHHSIVHSDIHPRNILVAENGEVNLIDFGLAQVHPPENRMPRGGISFFHEPEYACALRDGLPMPVASFAGEQYALAALIYYFVTGKHYLHFSYEKEVLLEQIINEAPLSFLTYDIDIDAAIETVLFKALSKDPSDRYPSVADFKTALEHIKQRLNNDHTTTTRYSFTAFCDTIKNKFGFGGRLIEGGLQMAPTSSVNYGAAGIAYMYYRMALIESDPQLLSLADVWVNRAYDYVRKGDPAFYSADIEITPSIVGSISIYHTASGVHLVQALVSKAIGDITTYQHAVLNFIADASKPCESLDLTIGRSSVLIGCTLLYDDSSADEQATLKKQLRQFGNTVMNEIWSIVDTYELISENNPINYKGIAHGWAGIMYATLCWCRQSGTTLPTTFMQRMEQLVKTAIREEDYIRWSLTNDNAASWPGWCHGSAGYTFLWSELYKFTGNESYLEIAEKTAKHFLAVNIVSNVSLCCGIAGECYALLNLYNTTKKDRYLTEAKKRSKILLQNVYASGARNNSLYKGDIGVAVLLTELTQPQYARMPLFE